MGRRNEAGARWAGLVMSKQTVWTRVLPMGDVKLADIDSYKTGEEYYSILSEPTITDCSRGWLTVL